MISTSSNKINSDTNQLAHELSACWQNYASTFLNTSFVKQITTLTFCILIASTICGGRVDAAKRENGQGYQQVLQAQLQSADSEAILTKQMHAVAQAWNKYRETRGHFPEEGIEAESLQTDLSLVAGPNAYVENVPVEVKAPDGTKASDLAKIAIDANVANRPVSKEKTSIIIQVDLSVSQLQLLDLQKSSSGMSKSSSSFFKIAKPGSIVIVHNTEDFFVLWGADINGRPVIDKSSGKYLLITPLEKPI